MGFSSFLRSSAPSPAPAPAPAPSGRAGFSAFLRGAPAPAPASSARGFSAFLGKGSAPAKAPESAKSTQPTRKVDLRYGVGDRKISRDKVLAFRQKYVFGRKDIITPDDLRTALQAIHDAFDERELFGGISPYEALNDIWAEDLHINLEWDAATGRLKALDPKEPREYGRERYRGFAVKDGRYVLPPEVRKLAGAIAAKQQTYRRGLAADRGLPVERMPYRILVTLGTLSAQEAARLGFGEYPETGYGHIQYDASGAGETKWTRPLQIEGQEWIQTEIPGSNRNLAMILQRVVPRAQWSGPTFTTDQAKAIRNLGLPADDQRLRVRDQLEPGMMSYSLLLPGQFLTAGGKPYVATNEVRTVTRSPFADQYYLGEWYEAKDGTVFGVVGFVSPSGDEPTRKVGYGKGAKKIAVDRVYAVFSDDPTTVRVHPVALGDRRIRMMGSIRLGMSASQKKWDGLPVVSDQAMKQLQRKTSGLTVPGSEE